MKTKYLKQVFILFIALSCTPLRAQSWGWIEDMDWETNVKAIEIRGDNIYEIALFDVSKKPFYTFYDVKSFSIDGDVLSLEFIEESDVDKQDIYNSVVSVQKWTVDLKDLYGVEADAGNDFNQLIFDADAIEIVSANLAGMFMSTVEGSEKIEYANVMNLKFSPGEEEEMYALFKNLTRH